MGEPIRLPQAFRLPIDPITAIRWQLLKLWLETDLSVNGLCEKTGMSRRTVREIITGRSDPTFRTMSDWAWACGGGFDLRLEPIADRYLPRPRPSPTGGKQP